MSGKWIVISSCFCFVVLTFGSIAISVSDQPSGAVYMSTEAATLLSFSSNSSKFDCELSDLSSYAPSLQSFLMAATAVEGRELSLNGLAVFSKLANACQPLVDLSKSRIPVNKIALITLRKEFSGKRSLCELAVNAQNAGYSVAVLFLEFETPEAPLDCKVPMPNELIIPFVYASACRNRSSTGDDDFRWQMDSTLKAADRTNVQIRVLLVSNYLKAMAQYLKRLYFWFLLGPIITLEWLRRKKKLCCVTITQHVDEESASGNEEIERLNSIAEESWGRHMQDTELEENEDELQHLIATNNARSDLTSDNMPSQPSTNVIRRVARYVAVGCGYMILLLAALPVGISSGGLSFFRFDEEASTRQNNFWDELIRSPFSEGRITVIGSLPLWWPVVQIFCFFLYSRFACKTTWIVFTNLSKLIRSDWFSSNIYLLVLCVVVPYCSYASTAQLDNFESSVVYFAAYNTACTVCNFFLIVILNKHKFVTRYVFYISVCMICAYVESDIVAVFYFILNSQGSLTNLKLTALRTVAISLTLTLSLSSSTHIICKLMKPEESLFEGLSEK